MLFAVKYVYSQKVTLNYFKNTKKEAVKTILQIVVTVAKSNKFPEATLQKHVNFRNFVVCINFSLYTTLRCEIFSIYITSRLQYVWVRVNLKKTFRDFHLRTLSRSFKYWFFFTPTKSSAKKFQYIKNAFRRGKELV